MIKAIIFDCFGVLTTDGWLPFKDKHFASNLELKQQATNLNRRVDAGLASYEDFVGGLAEMAGITAGQVQKEIEGNVANEPLLDLIRSDLKPSYKLGILSNAGANWLDHLIGIEQTKLFDAVSLSYKTGFVKPDERAYRDVVEKLGVEPGKCLFVDDQERYCTAATEYGMSAIWYRSFDQFKAELEALLTA